MLKLFAFGLFIAIPLFAAHAAEISITVYNDNLALVKDVRSMKLGDGTSEIKFTDVAAQIDPTSVHFKSLSSPEAVSILEQNFEYDLVNSKKILEKYVDEEITVFTKDGGPYTGNLLSASDGNIILQPKEGNLKIISAESILSVDFPKLPEGLITKPTLVWLLKNDKAGSHNTEVSYLTSGIEWHAEYVAVSKKNDSVLELNAWVSVDNRSGAAYDNAKLKLIAGDVHRVQTPRPMAMKRGMAVMAEMADAGFEEKSFFEYHLYTLQRRTTLKNNQIKQISLFPTAEAKVKKLYIYEASRNGDDVRVNLEFKNSAKVGLGIPLPKGKLRVYKEDEADKSLEFIGEDYIDHTPKNEKVRVYLGNAFDIKAERAQKDQKKLSKRSREESYEVKIRNHKEEDVSVTVVEKFWGDWEIKKSTHDFVKKDAYSAEFILPVKKDGETVLEYTVFMKW